MKQLIGRMLWKLETIWHKMGFGMIPDDHPDARPKSFEIISPKGANHTITIDPDGRIHGLPGSPPHGLQGNQEYGKWQEKMEAFGGW